MTSTHTTLTATQATPNRRHAKLPEPEGLWEFAAENRPEGWNVWLTFAISPAAPPAAPQSRLPH